MSNQTTPLCVALFFGGVSSELHLGGCLGRGTQRFPLP